VLSATAAIVSMVSAVRPAVSSATPAARRAGEKAPEEGVELGHSILGDLNDNFLVLRGGWC
jgi:hypothetical protein